MTIGIGNVRLSGSSTENGLAYEWQHPAPVRLTDYLRNGAYVKDASAMGVAADTGINSVATAAPISLLSFRGAKHVYRYLWSLPGTLYSGYDTGAGGLQLQSDAGRSYTGTLILVSNIEGSSADFGIFETCAGYYSIDGGTTWNLLAAATIENGTSPVSAQGSRALTAAPSAILLRWIVSVDTWGSSYAQNPSGYAIFS